MGSILIPEAFDSAFLIVYVLAIAAVVAALVLVRRYLLKTRASHESRPRE